ncbi:MAG: PAS domain-containing protein [Halobacteriovoraceae bacterium]|nr:PAS domain-containing protein [Halobacteriovoraceae bacterium]MBT5095584.1 PAS domain-containing protein [Halobacteriovoraceae bacterium]
MKYFWKDLLKKSYFWGIILASGMALYAYKLSDKSVESMQGLIKRDEQVRTLLRSGLHLQRAMALAATASQFKSHRILSHAKNQVKASIELLETSFDSQKRFIPLLQKNYNALVALESSFKIKSRIDIGQLKEIFTSLEKISIEISKYELTARQESLKNYQVVFNNQIKANNLLRSIQVLLVIFVFQFIVISIKRQMTEEQLAKEKKDYVQIYNSVVEGIILTTSDGRVLHCNQGAEKILSLRSEFLKDRHLIDIFPNTLDREGSIVGRDESPFHRAFVNKKGIRGKVLGFHTLNIESKWISVNIHPQDRKRIDSQWIVSFSDISNFVEAGQFIDQQKKNIAKQEKFSALGVMASGIAHEINNPLTIIQINAEQIIDSLKATPAGQEEKVSNKAQKISDTVFQITKIITGMKTISRSEEGDPFVQKSLPKIFSEIWPIVEAKLNRMDVSLKTSHFNKKMLIECRPGQIGQVLINMITNSAQAIQDNPGEKWIEVACFRRMGHLELQITDSGDGIPKEVQEKLFQPFFTTKDVGQGTGLGMSITHKIIMAHGGSIEIDDDCHNTRFVIKIPYIQTSAIEAA